MTAKVTTYSYSLMSHKNVVGTTELLKIASILSFLVYGGFEKNLDTKEVPKQVLAIYRYCVGQKMTLHIHQLLLS